MKTVPSVTSRPPAWQPAARTTSTTIQGTEGSVVYDLERMCEFQVYFKADADKDNGRDCGFRTVLLNPQHRGFQCFQPAGRHRNRIRRYEDAAGSRTHAG